jgi:hypothetical protein
MTVPVAIVSGEQPIDGFFQIRLGARSCFHEGEAGSGVRRKDVTQPVTFARTETPHLARHIGHPPPARAEWNLRALHPRDSTVERE